MREQVLSDVRYMSPKTPADGDYPGTWGGYTVRFEAQGRPFEGKTKDGIRTPSAPVIVKVRDGQCTVELVKV